VLCFCKHFGLGGVPAVKLAPCEFTRLASSSLLSKVVEALREIMMLMFTEIVARPGTDAMQAMTAASSTAYNSRMEGGKKIKRGEVRARLEAHGLASAVYRPE
jgi:hypothetical protein